MKWLLLFVCVGAAISDILWRKIPNLWFAAGFLAQFAVLAAEGRASWYLVPIRCMAVLLVFYPAWKIRVVGAGDVKLFGMAAGILGLSEFFICFVCSLFFGGILSGIHMARHRNFFQRLSYFLAWFRRVIPNGTCKRIKWIPYMEKPGFTKENTIPFSLAFLLGYLFRMCRRGGFF